MKQLLVLILAAVALYVLFSLLRSKTPKRQGLTQVELLDVMRQRAQQAVERAAGDFQIALDRSPASVERVDEILGRLHESYVAKQMSEADVVREAFTWGAYVGEVIKKTRPAEWAQGSEAGGPHSFPIVYTEEKNSESFPINWCSKRIKNGDEDNIWHKFNILVIQRDTSGPL